jgi:hypothetical protein
MGQTNIYTKSLVGTSITINAADNVLRASVLCKTGTVTYNGNARFQNTASGALTLSEGQGATITAQNVSLPIDGVTINASGGEADILLSTQ